MLRNVYATALLSVFLLLGLVGCEKSKVGEEFEPGATLRIFKIGQRIEGHGRPDRGQTPNHDILVSQLELQGEEAFAGTGENFIAEITGRILVPSEGDYEMLLKTNGKSLLQIGGKKHPFEAGASKSVTASLKEGLQRVTIYYSHNEGTPALELTWRPEGKSEVTPVGDIYTEAGVTRVVAPGEKRIYGVNQPGHGAPLDQLHPGYRVKTIRPEWFKPLVGGMCFLPDGRLAITTFPPALDGFTRPLLIEADHKIYALGNLDAEDRDKISVNEIAGNLVEPCGILSLGEYLYVSGRHEITRLSDPDGDGYFDKHETLASGWESDNFHHFTFGLVHKDGYLYASLSTSIDQAQDRYSDLGVVGRAGPNPPNRGVVFRVPIDRLGNTEPEYLSGGLRTPNGLGLGPKGEIFVSDNQGAWLSCSEMNEISEGSFHGHFNPVYERKDGTGTAGFSSLNSDQPVTPPVVYFPHGRIGLSPSAPVTMKTGPFAGQVLVGDVTYGGIRRVFIDEVDGHRQGCVFRFTMGLESGVNRMLLGEDGSIYTGATGSAANWSWLGKTFGLQKLEPTGQSVMEYESITATEKGFVIRFTKEVSAEQLEAASNYRIRSHRYLPTPAYGGVGYRKSDRKILAAKALPDGRSVELEVEGLRPETVVHFVTSPTSTEGEEIWSSEAWYTLNHIPGWKKPTEEPYRPDQETEITPLITDGFNGWRFPKGGLRPWSYSTGVFTFYPFDEDLDAFVHTTRPIDGDRIQIEVRSHTTIRPWFYLRDGEKTPVVVHFGQVPASLPNDAKAFELSPPDTPSWSQTMWFDQPKGEFTEPVWSQLEWQTEGGELYLSVEGRREKIGDGLGWSPGATIQFGLGASGTKEADDTGFASFRRIGSPK